MSTFQISTDAEIAAQALAFLRNRFPSRDSSTESFLGKLARAFAMVASGIQKSALDANNDAVPGSSNSTAALDNFAYVFGVPSSAAGQYGRKGATTSGGGVGQATGTNGTFFPAGTQLVAPDGSTILQLLNAVTIAGTPPGAGTVTATFGAVTPGTAGNLAAGTTLTWISAPTGADPAVTLTAGLSGAVDQESDTDLLGRILLRLQQPPKGGVASDYREWAEGIAGVERAYVYPLRGGLGTVHAVLTGPGSGTARNPGSTVKSAVDTYINGSSTVEGTRPVTTQGVLTLLPYQPGTGAVVRLRLVPSGGTNAFDWVDTATAYTVSSYTAPSGGTAAQIVLSAIPATLSAALAAGKNPRLQILSTAAGAPATQQVQATALVSGTTVSLQNPLPSTFVPPNNGDTVYAGGPIVTQIATAILTYIDGLGPSRASGYADPLDVWEDTIAIARMVQIALDQKDGTLNSLAANTIANGVTVNGSTADLQAADNSFNGPQLLFARWVSVTQ